MIQIKLKPRSYWLAAWSKDGQELSYYDRPDVQFATPQEVYNHAVAGGSMKFGASGIIYMHYTQTANSYTTTYFHTLAAANRFHKSLQPKQPA